MKAIVMAVWLSGPLQAQDSLNAAFSAALQAARTFQPQMEAALNAGEYHRRHAELYGRGVPPYNLQVLRAVDIVQGRVPPGQGGGYFIGPRAKPPESPVGHRLALFGETLLEPPRPTSYCTGATYAALIEALNLIMPQGRLTPERVELMRMQNIVNGRPERREDGDRFWGHWNADNMGNHFALVQYSRMGVEVSPEGALPGDFMNISWRQGPGHSVVFLGWHDDDGEPSARFWSSNNDDTTDGFGDRTEPLKKMRGVKVVRLTDPAAVLTFTPGEVQMVPWDVVNKPKTPMKPLRRGRRGRRR